MTQENTVASRSEFETSPYGALFIVQMVVLAFLSLGLHVGLTMLANPISQVHSISIPLSSGPMGMSPSQSVLPGNSVIFEGELWVTVAVAGPQMSPILTRPPSARLIAFDLKTGKPRETGLKLSPSPVGLVVCNDTLWAVSEDAVCMIVGGQIVSRYPKRALNVPSNPFLYHNQLAVIDKDRNDDYSLLTWNEGEWTVVGKVKIPLPRVASRWNVSVLRVISDQDSCYLFYSDGQALRFRKGIEIVSDADPVSALDPANETVEGLSPNDDSGWSPTRVQNSWGTFWDTAMIDGELHLFCATSWNNSTILHDKMRDGSFVGAAPNVPLQNSSFSVASGQTGYFVGDDLRLHLIDSSHGIYRVPSMSPVTDYTRLTYRILALFAPYVIATSLLVLGTSWLMERHRSTEYLYGKRTVRQASVLRRAIARAVDTFVTVFPATFWFMVAVTIKLDSRLGYEVYGVPTSAPFVLFSIFGMWLGSILIVSYMEGYYGITPGKWLLGIRTRRTTLRPCGMIRSLSRQLLVYIDSVFLLMWLPGVLLIAFTGNWQRLGDLASDTVVIVVPPPTDPNQA